MGGTFDPIHMGHLIAAERARISAKLDNVWFIPTHTPPHKKHAPQASPQHRFEMLCQATVSNPYFHAVDVELKKGGISFSIDTIEYLITNYPQHEWAYIIGADMLAYLPQWHRIDEIFKHLTFIVLVRPGYELKLDHIPASLHSRITVVTMPLIEISSSEIRASLHQDEFNRYSVPESVYRYMKENHLYES
jgi:nicotinate-nucleotide adenylyltransferase